MTPRRLRQFECRAFAGISAAGIGRLVHHGQECHREACQPCYPRSIEQESETSEVTLSDAASRYCCCQCGQRSSSYFLEATVIFWVRCFVDRLAIRAN